MSARRLTYCPISPCTFSYQQGSSFFQGWDFFTGSDPTNGIVTYIDQNTAVRLPTPPALAPSADNYFLIDSNLQTL